jgi:hypothetical protein
MATNGLELVLLIRDSVAASPGLSLPPFSWDDQVTTATRA